tara:strand:- start:31838 stop:32350 length:513 start_codon:yes stop_codon:yes gene_type:complete
MPLSLNLDQERMEGGGADQGYNLLHGLNDLCLKYVSPQSVILELGCHQGVSAELFAQYAAVVHTIDVQAAPPRLKGLLNIVHHQGRFNEITQQFQPQSFDLIYIDGMHDYEAVREDIKLSLPLIKDGGYLSGHDYYTEVQRSIDTVIGIKPEIFSDSSWILKKEGALASG